MNIVNFGSCNIDYVYQLHHIVQIGETEQSDRRDVFPGGKGLNQSIAIAKTGAKIYHAGCIGHDGQLLLDTLIEGGVDISFIQRVNEPSGHAVIQVSEKGENSIFIHSGANAMFSKEYIDHVLSHFREGDILLLQNEINNIDYIIEQGYRKGMITVINPSPIDERIQEIDFNKISYAVMNEIEGEYLSGCNSKDPSRIISALRKKYPLLKIVLTLGEMGCMYHNGTELFYHNAYEVPVVDSTAAGDTFMGYFVASLSKNISPQKLLAKACIASALAVSKEGAAPSIPYNDEVTKALTVLKPKNTDTIRPEEELLKKIDDYIDHNLATANLSGLSEALNYSLVYTGHVAKKITQKSFAKYIQEKRCAMAATLLKETDLPISQIIHQIGYNNESFFRSKFKELYGMAPLSYRKTINKKASK